MEIPLCIRGDMYDGVTLEHWQQLWHNICKMAYEGEGVCEKIITRPGLLSIDGKIVANSSESMHSRQYGKTEPINSYFITLENVWRQYSEFHGPEQPKVIPELKELVVPYELFNCLGVQSWFRYSFPNCKVFYWDE